MVFGAVGRFFGKIKDGLAKTRLAFGDALRTLVGKGRKIDREFLEELEDRLLAADIGVRSAPSTRAWALPTSLRPARS